MASDAPLAGALAVSLGKGDLPVATMTHPSGATCEVYIYGGHLTSWCLPELGEQIFVSKEALYTKGKAIRGGVPVCFPQFADQGPLKQHGFARTSDKWEIAEMVGEPDPTIVLSLKNDEETAALWAATFEMTQSFTLGETTLTQEMSVTNTGTEPLDFTTALHTYFKVADVNKVAVEGLQGLSYADKVLEGQVVVEDKPVVTFGEYVDRIYFSAPDVLQITEPTSKMVVSKEGFPDAVVWNLGPEKVKEMKDMGDEEWTQYVCVECAAIGTRVVVAPGETWTAKQSFKRT